MSWEDIRRAEAAEAEARKKGTPKDGKVTGGAHRHLCLACNALIETAQEPCAGAELLPPAMLEMDTFGPWDHWSGVCGDCSGRGIELSRFMGDQGIQPYAGPGSEGFKVE
jgi:hypothetical protein